MTIKKTGWVARGEGWIHTLKDTERDFQITLVLKKKIIIIIDFFGNAFGQVRKKRRGQLGADSHTKEKERLPDNSGVKKKKKKTNRFFFRKCVWASKN